MAVPIISLSKIIMMISEIIAQYMMHKCNNGMKCRITLNFTVKTQKLISYTHSDKIPSKVLKLVGHNKKLIPNIMINNCR